MLNSLQGLNKGILCVGRTPYQVRGIAERLCALPLAREYNVNFIYNVFRVR